MSAGYVVPDEWVTAAMDAWWRAEGDARSAFHIALAAVIPAIQAEALQRAAALQECGCTLRAEVVKAAADYGPNSAARWKLCGCSNCGALDAADIRALGDAT